MPLVSVKGKNKALLYGILSGVVEPMAAILVMMFAGRMTNIQIIEPLLIGFSVASISMIAIEMLKECKGKMKNVVITAIIAWISNVFLDFILA